MSEQSWLESLNDRQLEAVSYGSSPLLVLAGPGSGKTRILTNRIAWLVKHKHEPPDSILAVTFTNHAAEEMRERLYIALGEESSAVWVYTFHATAVRILRRFGAAVGVDPDFAIIDEDEQHHAINRMLRKAGLSREYYPISEIVSYISERKNALKDPADPQLDVEPTFVEIAREYGEWLEQRKALDFDDLIRYAVGVLRYHKEAREHYHGTLRHILVDEYQDVNAAQYELLKLLALPNSSITVVADDDQAIYGWRGSRPELIDLFVERYHPHIVKLELSYRCPPHILYGAQRLITHKRSQERQRFMRSNLDGKTPIFHYIFDDIHQEQRWLVTLIRKLIEERGHKPSDIAILYRTHRLADPVEQSLLQAGFKVNRVRKESFFDQSIARDIIRYLQLTRLVAEENFTSAVNFPRRQIDELTMIQLQRLAKAHDCTMVELARRSDDFPEITPLTRAHLRRFRELIEERLPSSSEKASEGVQSLFAQLDAFRSPWREDELNALQGLMAFTDRPTEADELADVVDSDKPIIILHPATIDGYTAASLLKYTLRDYLNIPRVETSTDLQELLFTDDSVLITLGDTAANVPETLTNERITIAASTSESRPYALTTYVWRCAQMLLISYEILSDGSFVIYDVETTGVNVRRDEIVEIAASLYENQQPVGETFHHLVRPLRGYIPRAASRIHGIYYDAVAGAPTMAQVLPDFLDYVDDKTVVGHNIAHFDNRFLDKACGEFQNGKGFDPPYIDTLRLAKRLIPHLPRYTLESLLQSLSLGNEIKHRAEDDLKQTSQLFFNLTERIVDEKEQEALSEFLPLVGLATLSEASESANENQLLLHGAARMLEANRGRAVLEEAIQSLPGHLQADVLEASIKLEQHIAPTSDEDLAWNALRDDFFQQVTAFEQYSNDPTLMAFLDYQALLNSHDTFSHAQREDQITMMTLHNAKGSEFPVVIIIGVEQENLPLWRTLKDPRQLAEERRVLYVGITRAQESVYLFSTRDRKDGFKRSPSRFAFEIPAEYVRRFKIDRKGQTREID